jgi:hypothetical protein
VGVEFLESDIRDALTTIEQSQLELYKQESNYTPWERHSKIIRELREHILLYDLRARTYAFTAYGESIFRAIHNALTNEVNPNKVDYILLKLLTDLSLLTSETFLQWLEVTLPDQQGQVLEELRKLDDGIRVAIRRLRFVSGEDDEFLIMLKGVNSTLELLMNQADDMQKAFRHFDGMELEALRLRTTLSDHNYEDAGRIIELLNFIRASRRKLSTLRDRLGKVQPRIRELFSNLHKRQFDRQSERFLLYLLDADHGKLSATEVMLPDGVTAKPAGIGQIRYFSVYVFKRKWTN